ncbi:hypothetical protein T4B_4097 [Trichinella pseudospiralis]|uniref:Uncharacterized protein n=1 Tax=Trichinella pseudospiralis TaxID=6337 RepID=A0A0V1HMM6_TRIPS|nr:hypothetical protein T4B_4097 [Trichinella pseudospiralis]
MMTSPQVKTNFKDSQNSETFKSNKFMQIKLKQSQQRNILKLKQEVTQIKKHRLETTTETKKPSFHDTGDTYTPPTNQRRQRHNEKYPSTPSPLMLTVRRTLFSGLEIVMRYGSSNPME